MKHSHNAAMKRLATADSSGQQGSADRRLAWQRLGLKLLKLETQLTAQNALAFAFIEGSLVKALREGKKHLLY
jgi:midasin (ATPase involved in ribosome maturation)